MGLPWEKKAVFLTDYMARLKSAGYSQTFRIDILKQAVARYEGMLGSNREGKQPMYRSKEWIKANRNQVGLGCGKSGKSNWIAKGGYDTVMFVPATPQSELAQLWRGVVDNFNGPIKVKIVEEGGRTLKSKLQKSNPRKVIGCVELDCLVCTNGRGEGGDCQRPNVGYKIKCLDCPNNVLYIGETSKSGYLRGLDHVKNYRGKKQDCPLWRHAAAEHDGRMDVKFAKKVVRKFRDPLTRQCNESVRMQRCEADVLLNSKSEWHGPATVTLQAECGR